MGKVVLFAVLTLDGCLADSSPKAGEWLAGTDTAERFGVADMKGTARPLDENAPLTLLSGWVKDSPAHSVYLIEATTVTAGIINGMLRFRQVDEIILCTIPVIAGNGCRLFQSDLPANGWTCRAVKAYKDGALKAVYQRKDGASVQKMNTSPLKRLFRK